MVTAVASSRSRNMFKYALKVDWPGVAANPCDGLDRLPPAVKINPNDEAPFTGHREWTLAETDRFLDFYRDEAQPFLTVSLMLYTGLRISDARKVGQSLEKTIDWRGTNVRCLVFDVSKGAKKRAREGKTKLRAIVPIVPQFAEALKRAPDISPTYLLNEHGNRWKSAKSLDRRMRRWLDAIVDEDGSQPFKDLSSHGLRYTAANWWAKTYRCTPHETDGGLRLAQDRAGDEVHSGTTARTRRPAWWSDSRRADHDDPPRAHCQPGCHAAPARPRP